MRILALDLSTATGWAIIEKGKPEAYGRIEIKPDEFPFKYPKNYVSTAKEIASRIKAIVTQFKPDAIVIEETNRQSRFGSRYSQKLLEFIHFAVADSLLGSGCTPQYMSTSEWRKVAGSNLSQADREKNAEVEKERDVLRGELTVKWTDLLMKDAIKKFTGKGPKAQAVLERRVAKDVKKIVDGEMRKLRVQAGEGRRTEKHVSIEKVNATFGTRFIQKDNDIAEAILLGVGFHIRQQQASGG